MSNDRKFPGKMISMLYPSRSGLTSRSMPIDEANLAQIQDALQSAGPGAKLALKPTSDKYRAEKAQQMKGAGKQGSPAQYILEVLSAAELSEERERLQSQTPTDL